MRRHPTEIFGLAFGTQIAVGAIDDLSGNLGEVRSEVSALLAALNGSDGDTRIGLTA
jgi:hypothetical protein